MHEEVCSINKQQYVMNLCTYARIPYHQQSKVSVYVSYKEINVDNMCMLFMLVYTSSVMHGGRSVSHSYSQTIFLPSV